MSLFELLGLAVLILTAVVLVMVALVGMRRRADSRVTELVGEGDFSSALAAADTGAGAERDELMAAAFAAKHLLDFERASGLVERVLADDPSDGEAWLERGLISAYGGDHQRALESLKEAGRQRADLLESIALHRAWVELQAGDEASARRRFEEVAAPMRSKLETDLGPGDPLFAEWFFQAADLWDAAGDAELSEWARSAARAAAPQSQLVSGFCGKAP